MKSSWKSGDGADEEDKVGSSKSADDAGSLILLVEGSLSAAMLLPEFSWGARVGRGSRVSPSPVYLLVPSSGPPPRYSHHVTIKSARLRVLPRARTVPLHLQ